MALSHHVLNEAEHHAYPGAREAEMPVHLLRKPAGDERSERRSQVDTHVIDRKPGIPPRVGRIIQGPNQGAYGRLEETGSEHDENQPQIEEGQRPKREREVTESDDRAAEQNALVGAKHSIGHDAPEDRGRPRTAGVGAVYGTGVAHVEAEAARRQRRRHIKD